MHVFGEGARWTEQMNTALRNRVERSLYERAERKGHEAQDDVQFGLQSVEVVGAPLFGRHSLTATMLSTIAVALAAMAAFDLLFLKGAYLHVVSVMLFR
jgi:hypothetical protein